MEGPEERDEVAARTGGWGVHIPYDPPVDHWKLRSSAEQERSSPDLCVKAEEAPRLRLGCLGDLLFLEE